MELALFPLHVVLFPGRPLPLHIFEPRYRQLLDDCLAADRRFGVVAIRAGREVGADCELFDVGTVAEIESVSMLADSRADIATRGVQRFRILELLAPSPYPKAEVELLEDPPASASDRERARGLRALLVPYLTGLGAPEELLERLPADPNGLAYLAACAVQVELTDQQRLLECDSTARRLEATLAMLRRETSLMRHFGTVASLRPPGPGGAELN